MSKRLLAILIGVLLTGVLSSTALAGSEGYILNSAQVKIVKVR